MPDEEQVVLEGELVPDDDPVAPGGYRIDPGDDQVGHGGDDPAAEVPVSGSASAAVSSAGAAPAAAAPPAGAPDGAPGREAPAATESAGGAGSAGRWPEIQAMFVDDPRASVEQASGLVDDCVEALVVYRDHRDVRLDRRERVVRSLGGDPGERAEQRRLAGIGHAHDPDLHARTRASVRTCSAA